MWGIISLSKWWPIKKKEQYTIHDDLRALITQWSRAIYWEGQYTQEEAQTRMRCYRECAAELRRTLAKWKE